MEQITNLNTEFLDFEKAKVQTLTLEQLKRTHEENDIMGHPLKGMYHWQVIEMCRDIAERNGSSQRRTETNRSRELYCFRKWKKDTATKRWKRMC